MLRNYGVKKIHMRIASPPVKYPCYYGIDTPTKKELLASRYTIKQIKLIILELILSNLFHLTGYTKLLDLKKVEIKISQNLLIIISVEIIL